LYFVSEDKIIQPRTILVAESCNTDVTLMFIQWSLYAVLSFGEKDRFVFVADLFA